MASKAKRPTRNRRARDRIVVIERRGGTDAEQAVAAERIEKALEAGTLRLEVSVKATGEVAEMWERIVNLSEEDLDAELEANGVDVKAMEKRALSLHKALAPKTTTRSQGPKRRIR